MNGHLLLEVDHFRLPPLSILFCPNDDSLILKGSREKGWRRVNKCVQTCACVRVRRGGGEKGQTVARTQRQISARQSANAARLTSEHEAMVEVGLPMLGAQATSRTQCWCALSPLANADSTSRHVRSSPNLLRPLMCTGEWAVLAWSERSGGRGATTNT
jgi:hypothetical protein